MLSAGFVQIEGCLKTKHLLMAHLLSLLWKFNTLLPIYLQFSMTLLHLISFVFWRTQNVQRRSRKKLAGTGRNVSSFKMHFHEIEISAKHEISDDIGCALFVSDPQVR